MAIMKAYHLLLGRPWQYGQGVIHDGRNNPYTIYRENLVTIFPEGRGHFHEPNPEVINGVEQIQILDPVWVMGSRKHQLDCLVHTWWEDHRE